MNKRVVVFDAMGVLYDHADDVADLLVPFVIESGGTTDVNLINQAYLARSLGEIDQDTFWSQLGVTGDDIDDRYCQNHRLVPGVLAVLRTLHDAGVALGCLSNDVAEWSLTLRQGFGLDQYIKTWVISGEEGYRKPDPQIYLKLVELMDVQPDDVILIDDRLANLSTAHSLGMHEIGFGSDAEASFGRAAVVGMKELQDVLPGLLH